MSGEPLLITTFLDHARDHAPDREIVDYVDGTCVRRSTYRDHDARVRGLAGALTALGVLPATGWRRSRATTTATSSSTSPCRCPGRCCTR